MLCRGPGKLRGRREMDEAIAQIGWRSEKPSFGLGLTPQSLFADLVDRGHTLSPGSGATLSAQNRQFKAASFDADIAACSVSERPARSGLERAGNNSYHRCGIYGAMMLTHAQVWSAIDRLAARAGLSASGLARRAGLDPTTFNKSKRITTEGRARWPSTESIAKALTATETPIDVFVGLVNAGDGPATRPVPLLGFAEAGSGGYFDDGGFPAGEGWDAIAFPAVSDEHAYALEVSGQSMEPAYRDGDVIPISPAAPIRRGDRVVVKTRSGEVMAKELKRRTAKSLELRSLNTEHSDRTIAAVDVLWIARILWASQ
jgi:phage repressor protein C with HTH and peptisase S24 domain